MKKLAVAFMAIILFVVCATPTHASFVLFTEPTPASAEVPTSAAEKNVKEGNLGALSATQILSLTPKGYEEMSGKKMSFKQKFILKYVQHNIKRDLKKEGSVDVKNYFDEGDRRFNLGGFALGFLLGLIGVALAHIFSNNKSFRRSSWYGIGAVLIILVIAAAIGG